MMQENGAASGEDGFRTTMCARSVAPSEFVVAGASRFNTILPGLLM